VLLLSLVLVINVLPPAEGVGLALIINGLPALLDDEDDDPLDEDDGVDDDFDLVVSMVVFGAVVGALLPRRSAPTVFRWATPTRPNATKHATITAVRKPVRFGAGATADAAAPSCASKGESARNASASDEPYVAISHFFSSGGFSLFGHFFFTMPILASSSLDDRCCFLPR
jgi:hypothetical protein